jgi:hypothetical protein
VIEGSLAIDWNDAYVCIFQKMFHCLDILTVDFFYQYLLFRGCRISEPEMGRNAQQYFSYFVVVSLLSVEETGVLWSRIAAG